MAKSYLFDGQVPEGATVFPVGNLEDRPAEVPEFAKPSAIVGGRRQWVWKDNGRTRIRLVKKLEEEEANRPSRAALGEEIARRKAEVEENPTSILDPETPEEEEEDDPILSRVLQAATSPLDAISDAFMGMNVEIQQATAGMLQSIGVPAEEISEEDEELMRGVGREVIRGAALEAAIIGLMPVTGGASAAGHSAQGARVGAIVRQVSQLAKARSARVLAKSKQVRNAAAATGGISGGIGTIFGSEFAQQSEKEFAADAAAEVAGEIAAIQGITNALPQKLRAPINAFLKSGVMPDLGPEIASFARRTGGNVVGAAATIDLEEDPVMFGVTAGAPGVFNAWRGAGAFRTRRLLGGIDPRSPDAEGPAAAAYRVSEATRRTKEGARAAKRSDFVSVHLDDAKYAAEINRLHDVPADSAIIKASFFNDIDARNKIAKQRPPSAIEQQTTDFALAEGRRLFPNELGEDDIVRLSEGIDVIIDDTILKRKVGELEKALKKGEKGLSPQQVQELEESALEGIPKGFRELAGSRKLTGGRVRPTRRAQRVARGWQATEKQLNQSFNSPGSFKQYANFVADLERRAARSGLGESMTPTIEKLKDVVITKGILGSGLSKHVNPDVTTARDAAARIKFEPQKMLDFVSDKTNRASMDKLFGKKGSQSVRDLVELMAFQTRAPEASTSLAPPVEKVSSFLTARLAFFTASGALVANTTGVGLPAMLGLVGAAEVGSRLLISASRMMKIGVKNPDSMRAWVDAVMDGNSSKQQRLLRSMLRVESGEGEEIEEEDVQEEYETSLF